MNDLNNNIFKAIEDLKTNPDKINWIDAVKLIDPIIHERINSLDSLGRKFASKQTAKAWQTLLRGY